jgi:4-amino-4-deoxy-L-arabinose transferase-like glycosyltransferase
MSRRDLLFLFVLALAVNGFLALFVHEPRYTDDSYYFGGALRLAEGQGFTEPYFWNYVGSPAFLPQPSHLYWMPLTSIVAAVSMSIFGHSFRAAQIPLVLAASFLPLVAYMTGWKIAHLRRHALSAGLLTIFCGFYAGYWATTDAFGLYGLTASAALLFIGLTGEMSDWRLELVAGLCAGLAHLTRADGLLVLLVGLLVGLGRQIVQRAAPSNNWTAVLRSLVLLLGGYLLVMLPWFVRNTLAVGSPLGNGGLNTIWLTDYNDIFRYPSLLGLSQYLSAGWSLILQSKWDALVTNLQHIVGEEMLLFLAPFIIIGLWRLRQRALYLPIWIYALGLYAAMTFVFTFPGPRGGLFHSGTALLPAFMAAALAGLDAVVDWVAVRRRNWRADLAKRNFTGMTVFLAVIITGALVLPIVTQWNGAGDQFREVADGLAPGAVVMSNNPPGLWVATRHPGIPLVVGDLSSVLAAADHYSVQYIFLDPNHTQELEPLYQNESADRLTLVKKVGAWKVFEVSP